MTAPIVTHYEGTVIADPEGTCASMEWSSADVTTRVRHFNGGPAWRGQLWERVAERTREVSDSYASERYMNAWYRSQVQGNDRARMTGGHYYAKANVSTKRSGIIRAGKRVA